MNNDFNYDSLFSRHVIDGKECILLSRSVVFPSDMTLDIYDKMYVMSDKPWTVVSYEIYGSINLWWLLYSLNRDKSMFYAPEGSEITYIKNEYLDEVIRNIKEQL